MTKATASFNVYLDTQHGREMRVTIVRPGHTPVCPTDIEHCGELIWAYTEDIYALRQSALIKLRDEAVKNLAETQALLNPEYQG